MLKVNYWFIYIIISFILNEKYVKLNFILEKYNYFNLKFIFYFYYIN